MNPNLRRGLSWVITGIIPFFLVMTAIRLLLSPLFLELEYRAPGFPPDLYGFTTEDRLYWGRISLEYLVNDQGIEFLADQRLPDGAPLYNERELDHMVDVKVLVQQMLVAWRVLLWILVGLAVWALRGKWEMDYVRGLGRGGKLTIGLVLLILAGVAVSFNALFTGFHLIFFEGDTWLFNWHDSLIRLFPLRLWRDAFILLGLFTLGAAALLMVLERKVVRR